MSYLEWFTVAAARFTLIEWFVLLTSPFTMIGMLVVGVVVFSKIDERRWRNKR